MIDESLVGKSVVEDIFGNRGNPDQICPRPRTEEEVRALRHFVFTQVGNNQFLAMHLVGPLDARCQHRMALSGIAADNQHQSRLLKIGDRSGVTTISNGSEESHGGWRLAVARTVIHVVGADHRAGQLLHQIALFIRAF